MKRLMSVKELTILTGLSKVTIYKMLKRGQLPFAKNINTRWLFLDTDVEEWLKSRDTWKSLNEDKEV